MSNGNTESSLSQSTPSLSAEEVAHLRDTCPSPLQLFTAATAFSALLGANLTFTELQTLLNFLILVQSNISAIITQKEICEGLPVVPEENN